MITFISTGLAAQNLVPNPSFEEIETCNYEDTILPIHWSSPNRGTPDHFNTCAVVPVYRVPEALLCENLWPYTGDGYAGVYVYADVQLEIKEYLQAELIEPLQKDQYYWLSFQVSPTQDCPPDWGFSDAIGMGFTTEKITFDDGILSDNTSAYDLTIAYENRGMLIDRVGDWTEISACYQARGDESHIIVGSFAQKEETEFVTNNPSSVIFDYMFIDEVVVQPFDPLPDTVLWCEGELYLEGQFLGQPLIWNTDEIANRIQIDQGGYFSVAFEANNCFLRDTTFVVDLRNIEQFSCQDTICSGFSQSISPGIPGQYEWSTGATSAAISISQPGNYEVRVTNACDIFYFDYQIDEIDCFCQVYMPNVFSPNDDGLNDVLMPFFSCAFDYQFRRLSIYNRWGGILFESAEEEQGWNGQSKGELLPDGVYMWMLEYEVGSPNGRQKKVLSGDVTLIR